MHCPKFIWHSIIFLMVPKNWLIWVPCVSDPLPSYKKGVGPKVLLFAFLYVGCLCIVPRIIHTAFQFLFTLVMGTSNLCLSVQFFEKQERKSYQTVYNNRLLDIMSWGHQRGYFTPLRTIDINLYSDLGCGKCICGDFTPTKLSSTTVLSQSPSSTDQGNYDE